MSTEYKYPGMKKLLAGSFYQCWEEFDGRSPDEILQEAINESKLVDLNEAIEDLNKLFKLLDNTEVMRHLVGYEFGCNYSPAYDGKSEIEWLVEIRHRLVREKERRSEEERL